MRALVLATGLLLCAAAEASAAEATVAVLPLDKAAASEVYDGLGTALAGMLVTDLSQVPGLALVERQRLDDLLSEVKLAKAGFLDPKTAQKLGKGVGAQFVVVGSYSVVAKAFLLDARIVQVETGRIVQAAKGQGTVDDFVAVEKDLVEGLLDGLSVKLTSGQKRRLYVQAPTEKFSAFSAYGEGLARKAQGKDAEARKAFERALALDPRFEAARGALSQIRAVVSEAKAAARAEQAEYRDVSHAKVMAAYPSELSRKPGFTDDMASLAGFAMRLMVLENEARHCERVDEMMHYLDRVGWQVREPQRGPGERRLRATVRDQAKALEFRRLDSSVAPNDAARQNPGGRVAIFTSTYAFLIGDDRVNPHRESSGLAGAIIACHPPKARLQKLEALAAAARQRGKGHLMGARRGNFDLETSLDLLWAWQHAQALGANAALSARTKAVLARVEDDPGAKREMLRYIEHVLRMADMHQMHQTRRLGQEEAVLVRAMRGLAAVDSSVVSKKGPYCTHLVKTLRPQAKGWTRRWDKDTARENVEFALDRAGPMYGSLRDMGCLVGEKARFSDALDLHDLLANISRYARPDKKDDDTCLSAFQTAEQLATPEMRGHLENNPAQMGPALAHGYLMTLHGVLLGQGCVFIEAR